MLLVWDDERKGIERIVLSSFSARFDSEKQDKRPLVRDTRQWNVASVTARGDVAVWTRESEKVGQERRERRRWNKGTCFFSRPFFLSRQNAESDKRRERVDRSVVERLGKDGEGARGREKGAFHAWKEMNKRLDGDTIGTEDCTFFVLCQIVSDHDETIEMVGVGLEDVDKHETLGVWHEKDCDWTVSNIPATFIVLIQHTHPKSFQNATIRGRKDWIKGDNRPFTGRPDTLGGFVIADRGLEKKEKRELKLRLFVFCDLPQSITHDLRS